MKTITQIETMLERIGTSNEDREKFVMALEWVLDKGTSTSLSLEGWMNENWRDPRYPAGTRIRTKFTQANEVEREIPIGHMATIGEFGSGDYAIKWDDDVHCNSMGWSLWTAEELDRDAEKVAS